MVSQARVPAEMTDAQLLAANEEIARLTAEVAALRAEQQYRIIEFADPRDGGWEIVTAALNVLGREGWILVKTLDSRYDGQTGIGLFRRGSAR